jgi:hypothetical protein
MSSPILIPRKPHSHLTHFHAEIEPSLPEQCAHEFWASVDPSDREDLLSIESDFLAGSSIDPEDARFFLRALRHCRVRGLVIPFEYFCAIFNWISEPNVYLEALEAVNCILKEQPEIGVKFAVDGRNCVEWFMRLFESPGTFRGWVRATAENFVGAHRKCAGESPEFFGRMLRSILGGFGKNEPSPEYYVSVFSVLADLVSLLQEEEVREILQACMKAVSVAVVTEPNWQHGFSAVISCVRAIVSHDGAWTFETFSVFVEKCHCCVRCIDPRRTTALIPIFAFMQAVFRFGVNCVIPIPAKLVADPIDVSAAYVGLVGSMLWQFPSEHRFVVENPEVIELAMGLRGRGSVDQRLSAVRLFVALVGVLPDWDRVWAKMAVVDEISCLLLAAGKMAAKIELVDGLSRVVGWMDIHGMIPEIVEAFASDEFTQLFQAIVEVENETLQYQLCELGRLVTPFLEMRE